MGSVLAAAQAADESSFTAGEWAIIWILCFAVGLIVGRLR
jgi:hypothetical protein